MCQVDVFTYLCYQCQYRVSEEEGTPHVCQSQQAAHFCGNPEFLRHCHAAVYGAAERVPVGKMLSDDLCEDCEDRARYQSRRRHQFVQEERAPPMAMGLVPFEDWTPGQHLPDTMAPVVDVC
jgi:uncharacterized protein YlaI